MTGANRPANPAYRGLWAVLARFFKVPEHPPTLLALGNEEIRSFRPAPGFLGYLRCQFWIFVLLVAAGLFVLSIVLLVNEPLVAVLLVPEDSEIKARGLLRQLHHGDET